MKAEVTQKNLRENYDVYYLNSSGFLDDYPRFYNAGVYGWNFDAYTNEKRNICICVGYRPIGKRLNSDKYKKFYDHMKNHIDKLFNNYGFTDEAYKKVKVYRNKQIEKFYENIEKFI